MSEGWLGHFYRFPPIRALLHWLISFTGLHSTYWAVCIGAYDLAYTFVGETNTIAGARNKRQALWQSGNDYDILWNNARHLCRRAIQADRHDIAQKTVDSERISLAQLVQLDIDGKYFQWLIDTQLSDPQGPKSCYLWLALACAVWNWQIVEKIFDKRLCSQIRLNPPIVRENNFTALPRGACAFTSPLMSFLSADTTGLDCTSLACYAGDWAKTLVRLICGCPKFAETLVIACEYAASREYIFPSISHVPRSLDMVLAMMRANNLPLPEKELLDRVCAVTSLVDPPLRLHEEHFVPFFKRETLALIRRRSTEVCLAFQQLELPALVTVNILEADSPWSYIPFHHQWNIATRVKHFRK